MITNVLKVDPSRTSLIRRAWVRDSDRRFTRLAAAVAAYMGANTLGLVENADPLYDFPTAEAKLRGFNKWFREQVDQGILQAPPGADPARPWLSKYVYSAYRRGVLRAYLDTHKKDYTKSPDFYAGGQDEFLSQAFGRPETVDKLRLLYTRTYEELRGVTAAMSQQMSRVLAGGIGNGLGPMKIAKQMHDTISGISTGRARLIARTETIHAHAEGQLDAFEQMGLGSLGIEGEWSTADDTTVCDACNDMAFDDDGEPIVYTIEEARGLIPLHPNCRCCWTPSVGKVAPKEAK